MNFEQAAAIVRERSMGRCEGCGGRGTQTHHRQPRGMGGVSGVGLAVNLPSCLVRLCQLCHDRVESEREWARSPAVGLLVPRPSVPAEVPVLLVTIYGTGLWLLDDEGCYGWWHGEIDDAPRASPMYSESVGHVH